MPPAQKQQTLVLIKPNAVAKGVCGAICGRFEEQKFRLVAMKMRRLYRPLAETFYVEHRDKPFFPELVKYISSGPLVALVLEGEDAVARVRRLIGATDPSKAAAGTLRADFGESLTANGLHGSDTPEAAQREIPLLFQAAQLFAAPPRE